jgi:integrase
MRGIRRHYGTAQVRKAALRLAHLVELYQEEPRTLRGLRDRAVVLLGWAGAFRRSELAGLELRDVSNVAEGITVNLRRSKTDVDGAGQLVGIPRASRRQLCPVGALGAWIVGAGILEGPLFRELASQDNLRGRMSDRCVCRIVKAAAIRLGLDPRPFGGHSLRRGFAAEAARLGIPDRDIARQTRHKSAASLHVYTSEAGIFIDNVAARLL